MYVRSVIAANAALHARFTIWDKQLSNNIKIRGVPFCSCCSSWGHNLDYCWSIRVVCPICMGPHRESNHRAFAASCKGKPNHVPPVPPTTDGEPCPHPASAKNSPSQQATKPRSLSYSTQYKSTCARLCLGQPASPRQGQNRLLINTIWEPSSPANKITIAAGYRAEGFPL